MLLFSLRKLLHLTLKQKETLVMKKLADKMFSNVRHDERTTDKHFVHIHFTGF